MNRTLSSPITDEQIWTYRSDGVVLIKQAFDQDWIELLREAWNRMRRDMRDNATNNYRFPPEYLADDPDLAREIATILDEDESQRKMYTEQAPGFLRCKYMHLWSTEFREFALRSPAGELIGQVIGANEVRFFLDAIFMKEAGVETSTYWHADQSAWPTEGEHVPTMWMPLLPVKHNLSSLEFVAGSHHDKRLPWPNTYNAKILGRPADRPEYVDFETRRNDPSVRFLAFDMEPGDALVIHPRTYHGGGPNLHPTQPRIALSTRWFGDDVTWDPRPECINIPGIPRHAMRRGEHPVQDDVLPVVWRRQKNSTH